MAKTQDHLLFEKQAQIARAIGHPLRIAVVDFLKEGRQCVCDIAEHVGSERSNVSRHLAVMVNAGLLSYRKEGLKVIYELKARCVLEFLSCVTGLLKEQALDSRRLLGTLNK